MYVSVLAPHDLWVSILPRKANKNRHILNLGFIFSQGFASITIRRNDFWNGWIGFHRANSTLVIADEDSGQPARLTIERLNASFGALTVSSTFFLLPFFFSIGMLHYTVCLPPISFTRTLSRHYL